MQQLNLWAKKQGLLELNSAGGGGGGGVGVLKAKSWVK